MRAEYHKIVQEFLSIRNPQGRLVPFIFRPAQAQYSQNCTNRDLILKPRKLGFTTMAIAEGYVRAAIAGQVCAILAHTEKKVQEFLAVAKFIHSHIPEAMKPRVKQDNATTFSFANTDGVMMIGTASAREFGRGSTYHFVHGSEVAWWRPGDDWDTFRAVSEAVPPDGCIVLESTANGRSGLFFDLWQAASTQANFEYKPHFFPWWAGQWYTIDLPQAGWEYLTSPPGGRPLSDKESLLVAQHGLTPGQIAWRRQAIDRLGEEHFYQEYPEDDVSAFVASGSPYFPVAPLRAILSECRPPALVEDGLQIWRPPYLGGVYLVGADVGGGGSSRDPNGVETGDRSAAVVLDVTRGRNEFVATFAAQVHPIDFAAHLYRIAQRYNDALLVIEKNSGFGQWVIDKLLEIGYERVAMFQRHGGGWDYGWVTSAGSKPALLAEFHQAITGRMFSLWDHGLVNELLNIVDRKTARGTHQIGAVGDAHDDLAMAAMIAWFNRELAIDPNRADFRPTYAPGRLATIASDRDYIYAS